MKLLNQALVSLLFALALLFTTVPQISAQDQVELPSWEIGWETDMDGVYELELSGEDDILDSIEFTDEELLALDYNGDGTSNVVDLVIMVQTILNSF